MPRPRIRWMEWYGGPDLGRRAGPVHGMAHAAGLCVRRVQNADGTTPGVSLDEWEARLFEHRDGDAVAVLTQAGDRLVCVWC